MLRLSAVVAGLLALTLAAPAARAGVVDSPLPAPFKQHVFTVPGVLQASGIGTYFSCTNLDSAPVTIGIEFFSRLGGGPTNDAASASLNVAAGASVRFGTLASPSFSQDITVGGAADRGSARILATSKKIACTAFAADANNIPPTVAWQLTIIAKTKQKAAN